ncbi:MAG: peroxiredoxin [Methylophaga sp.]|nr:peroxiredoxin [Methylophaga sp.]
MKDLHQLPDNLPVPADDGACDHLEGMSLPSQLLQTSSNSSLDLSAEKGIVVIFFYPMIGRPDSPPMVGWNEIPGARGCTPQTCSFRDSYNQLTELGAKVFGASSQALEEQNEAVARLKLPFELLNDSTFKLTESLNLPTFEYQGVKRIKRLTLVMVNGVIRKVFYPVFPSDQNVNHVISWLNEEMT